MPRRGKIRWRDTDNKRLSNTVRKFNAKITRVKNRSPEIADIQPEKVSVSNLKKLLKDYDRAEYKRVIGKMERYLRNGAEMPYTTRGGVNTTVWQKKELDNTFRAINARRKAELKRYNPSTFTGTMGTIEQNNLRPRKNTIQSIKPVNWEAYVENLERQLMAENPERKSIKYKENFLKAIANTIGDHSKLYQAVKNIDPARLYQYYYTEPLLSISFTSDPKSAEEIESIMLDRFNEVGEVTT